MIEDLAAGELLQRRARDRIGRELHTIECRIASLTRWQRPKAGSIEAEILPSLEAKRDRLALALADLNAALPPKPSRLDVTPAADIQFKPQAWHAAGTVTLDDAIGEIPACLKRARA